MYNDTIDVSNKIISDKVLAEIFQKMDDGIQENNQIWQNEKVKNEKYTSEYQEWTTKDFRGIFKCTFDFYDSSSITVDNYVSFMTIFNNRLHEVKNMWVRYKYEYWMGIGRDTKYITQYIEMNIYENKIKIDVKLSDEDKKMNDIFELIKEKIFKAPTKYNRTIRKRNIITNKIILALGIIPGLVICTLLVLVPTIRQIYGMTYILFPIAVILVGFVAGNIIIGSRIEELYSTLVPEKKYAGYDSNKKRSVYNDDMEKFLNTSEVIIGKNIDNLKKRREIVKLEREYSKYLPIELFIIVILSIIMVVVGKIV